MLKNNFSEKEMVVQEKSFFSSVSRRKFLGYAGAATGLMAFTLACKKDNNNNNNQGVDLGTGDVGILNYAYALEQLEAAFYIQVVASLYAGITSTEQAYLTDIRDHEVAHREFFKAVLGSSAIGALQVDFSSVNFGSRASVLGTARTFEDLGVSAYNGAGKLLTDANNLLFAGKIVSVEARHAATIRELLQINSFADTTDGNGLDPAMMPSAVLAAADPFIVTQINASNLPTS